MTNIKKLTHLSEAEKAMSTRVTMTDDLDKVRQTLKSLQSVLTSQTSKVARYSVGTGRSMPEADIDKLDIEMINLITQLRNNTQGLIDRYRTRKHLPGIRATGVQGDLFNPIYIEAGTNPAGTQKGGNALAK